MESPWETDDFEVKGQKLETVLDKKCVADVPDPQYFNYFFKEMKVIMR